MNKNIPHMDDFDERFDNGEIIIDVSEGVKTQGMSRLLRPRCGRFFRWLTGILSVAAFLASFFSLWFFYELYWRWRDCFNEQGRCFVAEESVVYTDNSAFWLLPFGIFLLIGFLNAFLFYRLESTRRMLRLLRKY